MEQFSEEKLIKAYENGNPADDHATGVTLVARYVLKQVVEMFDEADKKIHMGTGYSSIIEQLRQEAKNHD